jgi:ABC-type multidrug transport system permease subunit
VVIFNLDKLDLIFGSNLSVTVNWVGFLISLFITHALYIIIGLSIALTFKNNITGQVIGTLLNVVSIVFSGQVIPIHMLDSNQILEVISYISPFRYSTGLLHMS